MAKRNRLTNNSDETDIATLLSGDAVFSIPYFQRSYKWKSERVKQLTDDISSIVDAESGFHFLGAIIIHGQAANPSDPKVYEVIDGQQRITTLFLFIAATIRILVECGESAEAAGLFLKYLAIPRDTNLPSNLKLHPCKEDRAQFNAVINELIELKGFKEKISASKLKLLPASGDEKGILRNNYRAAFRFFRAQLDDAGIDRVRAVYRTMLESVSVVQIDVWDPTNGPKIFDSLNSRQEPMTIGDLVRNEIFSKVANEKPDYIEQIDQNSWQPFYKKFQERKFNLFDSYFFPYGLIQHPNLKKSEVYNALSKDWEHQTNPKEIIENLSTYQDAFIDLVTGTNNQKHTKPVANLFRNLFLADSPSSTYPFLMPLSQGVFKGTVSEKSAIAVLQVIESFLVRRAACGHEPTGLHAVFKRLWTDCGGKPDKQGVTNAVRKHKTVAWPNDAAFKEAIRSRPLYGAGITNYLLLEYDKSLGGDQPSNIPWIEHVLPVKPDKAWFSLFTAQEHEELKDLFANLIPLSKEMNIQLSNKPYPDKRKAYQNDAMFKSTRKFAEEQTEWTPLLLKARAEKLADWALKRWPE